MADANLSGNENCGINDEPANNKLTKLTTKYEGLCKYATLCTIPHPQLETKLQIF